MSFTLKNINIFCSDLKVYKSFISTVFDVDFDLEPSFQLSGIVFNITRLIGYQAPITNTFELTTFESLGDLESRIELFNYHNPQYPSQVEVSNDYLLITDPFGTVWKVSNNISL